MQGTPPIRKDASARARITKNVRSKQAELDKLVSWLTDHGVGKRNARRFLIKTGCDSLHSIAVWLRFQLPPLHLANTDCVMLEMHEQLGVKGKAATSIIEDLNVVDSINVDINQEATMHLFHTGTFNQAPSHMAGDSVMEQTASHMSADVVPEHRSYINQVAVARQRSGGLQRPLSGSQRSGRSLGRPSSIGRPNSGNSPEAAPAFWAQGGAVSPSYQPPLQPVNPGHRMGPGPPVGSPPSPYQQKGRQQQPQYTLYNNMLEGNAAAAMKQPVRGQQPWIMVSQTSDSGAPNSRGASVPPSSPRGRANFNGGIPGGQPVLSQEAYYNRPSGAQAARQPQAQSARSSRRGRGRGVGEGAERSTGHLDKARARSASAGAYAGAVCEGRHSSAARTQASSAADMILSVGVRGAPQRPVGEGKNAPQYEGYSNAGLSFIEENMSSMTGPSGLDLAHPPPARQSFIGGTGLMGGNSDAIASSQLPGVPTVSRPLDPGSYNQANAMLRKQLPHYKATVSVNVHWDQVFLWLLSILSVATYVFVRIWYLSSGKAGRLQSGVNVPYSWMVLSAEGALSTLGIYLHQNFWKQTVKFTDMPPAAMEQINKAVRQKGMSQTVHVLIATYTEPAVTVRECVLRLLVAPEPIYMEKMIYVCDDGHAKSEGPKKKAMVEELRILGHNNVFYVGDRVKKADQLNGKSANLNHVLLQKIYPNVRKAEEVPLKDIFMVMDCDHMVKPDVFNKMGPCMVNENTAVCLVPQCFHNTIHPDALDAANGDFMFGKLPFYFGAGVLFVTGTNVMVRARSAFEVCKFAEANAEASADGEDHRQLFTVDEISEDVVLGSRLHAAGFKGVFVAENLATGEVPLEARAMWRQRFRWFKGGHLFLLSPTSVFFEKHKHMSFYQKTLYWICLVANVVSIYAEPVIMSMPLLCLVFEVCVYGLDELLFWTHFSNTVVLQVVGAYYRDWRRVKDSFKAHVAFRVLWFTTVKACINTVMVMTGWKKSGVFKATPKLGETAEDAQVSARLPDVTSSDGGRGSDTPAKEKFHLHHIHDKLSKVTEVRKRCMPFDGTWDFWVLMFITFVTIFSTAMGLHTLVEDGSIFKFRTDNSSLKWLAISWALHQCTPGVLFAGYLATWQHFPSFLKVYVPFITISVFMTLFFIEFRIAYAFIQNRL